MARSALQQLFTFSVKFLSFGGYVAHPFCLQARGVKRCFNSRDVCLSNQLLAEELERSGVDAKDASRLLINPDFAQATDQSDGSEMFSPEDQKLEDELTQLE